MYKRISIRLVSSLSEDLKAIAKERGLTLNALISDIVWDFVGAWKTQYREYTHKANFGG